MITVKPPFLKEISSYISANTDGRFSFGDGASNLKIGELPRGVDGVYIVNSPGESPDNETPVFYYHLDFYSINENSEAGYEDLSMIYELFHQNHHWNTLSYYIFRSIATTQILDMDRNMENRKLWKLTVRFICRNMIS